MIFRSRASLARAQNGLSRTIVPLGGFCAGGRATKGGGDGRGAGAIRLSGSIGRGAGATLSGGDGDGDGDDGAGSTAEATGSGGGGGGVAAGAVVALGALDGAGVLSALTRPTATPPAPTQTIAVSAIASHFPRPLFSRPGTS